jgi:hypothetical protein
VRIALSQAFPFILTRVAGTRIGGDLAVGPSVPCLAAAGVRAHAVRTGAVIRTRLAGTVVGVDNWNALQCVSRQGTSVAEPLAVCSVSNIAAWNAIRPRGEHLALARVAMLQWAAGVAPELLALWPRAAGVGDGVRERPVCAGSDPIAVIRGLALECARLPIGKFYAAMLHICVWWRRGGRARFFRAGCGLTICAAVFTSASAGIRVRAVDASSPILAWTILAFVEVGIAVVPAVPRSAGALAHRWTIAGYLWIPLAGAMVCSGFALAWPTTFTACSRVAAEAFAEARCPIIGYR